MCIYTLFHKYILHINTTVLVCVVQISASIIKHIYTFNNHCPVIILLYKYVYFYCLHCWGKPVSNFDFQRMLNFTLVLSWLQCTRLWLHTVNAGNWTWKQSSIFYEHLTMQMATLKYYKRSFFAHVLKKG